MSSSDKTLEDPSRLKRFVQERRYADATRLLSREERGTIVDYGAGNGELALRLSKLRPGADIICYEPGSLVRQATRRLVGTTNVRLTSDSASIASDSTDLVYCLEVFEHLPAWETQFALGEIQRILKNTGVAIVGVSVEVGPPAVPKGLFRMLRRRGDFDAKPGNIWRALMGRTFDDRPTIQIAAGSDYFPHLIGFDYRRLRAELRRRFHSCRQRNSPLPLLGSAFNSEVFFVVRKS